MLLRNEMNVFTTAVLLVVTAKILKTAFEDESGTLLHQTISSDFLYVEDNRGTTGTGLHPFMA